ncbi:hypothetical protein LTR53_008652 [Teratosphaeriaceae sp. CCFEE 6253]|nr:hypothetical protein LTR53_008652 [Teratosphaeriaceae sp. CCFEE 6253]
MTTQVNDNDPCYELRDAGNKGVGLFARRPIPAGTLIVADTPIMTFSKKYEDVQIPDVVAKFKTLPGPMKERFMKLRTDADMPNIALDLDNQHLDSMAQRLVDLYRKFKVNTCSGEDGCAVYDLHCRLNHACRPNAEKRGRLDKGMECWATTDIAMGEEITICYHEELFWLTTAERRQNLPLMGYPWACECILCTSPREKQLISDLRRRIARHLRVVLLRRDLTTVVVRLNVPAVISRTMVQNSGWNIWGRDTIYCYLLAALRDLEGAILNGELSFRYA